MRSPRLCRSLWRTALIWLFFGACAHAQSQQQLQYTYDAAGNLVQVTRTGSQKADLTISNLTVGSVQLHTGGGYDIAATFTITNSGNAPATASWYDRGYLSSDSTLQDTDQVLSGNNYRTVDLAVGASYTANVTFTSSSTTSPGSAYLIVKADGGADPSGQFSPTGTNVVNESNEANNALAAAVTLPPAQPDLRVTSAAIGNVTFLQSGKYSVPITYTVTNAGGVAAQPSWNDLAYLSPDATLDNADENLGGYGTRSSSLAAGASYTATTTFTSSIATAPGAYTIFLKADGRGTAVGTGTNTDAGRLVEYDESNNAFAQALVLQAKPDLQVTNATVGSLVANQNGSYGIPVTFTVTNAGGLAAQPGWNDLAYLSADGTLDNADQNLGGNNYRSTLLAAGDSYTVTKTFITSTSTPSGAYTLFVKADGHGTVTGGTNTDTGNLIEGNDGNNVFAIALSLPAKPDLQISNTSIGTISVSQNGSYSIPVTFSVTNIGAIAAQPGWMDMVYLSVDATLDNADANIGGNYRNSVVGPGESYTVTRTFTTATSTAAGAYTLFAKADGNGTVTGYGNNTDGGRLIEPDETNNVAALALTLPGKPDLQVSNASIGAISVNQNGSYSMPVTFTVTNIGGVAAQPGWNDLAYLSADATLDNADANIGRSYRGTVVGSGQSYTVTITLTTTASTGPGTYSLFVKADGNGTTTGYGSNTDGGQLVEPDETNNVAALTITLPGKPDLQISNATVGTITKGADGSYSIPVTFTVTNSGGTTASAAWYDLAYLSTDGVLDNADQNLRPSSYVGTPLAPGGSYTVSKTFTTSTSTPAGSYYLILKADGHGSSVNLGTNTDAGAVAESDETNNTAAITLTLP